MAVAKMVFLVLILCGVKVLADCDGAITYYLENEGSIETPGYPDDYYSHNIFCQWQITVDLAESINIIIDDMQIQYSSDCGDDWLLIANDSSHGHVWKVLCGTEYQSHFTLPISIKNMSNSVYIAFSSDSSIAYEGFMLEWNIGEGSMYDMHEYSTSMLARNICIGTIGVTVIVACVFLLCKKSPCYYKKLPMFRSPQHSITPQSQPHSQQPAATPHQGNPAAGYPAPDAPPTYAQATSIGTQQVPPSEAGHPSTACQTLPPPPTYSQSSTTTDRNTVNNGVEHQGAH